jgi:hypothetical protein
VLPEVEDLLADSGGVNRQIGAGECDVVGFQKGKERREK